MKPSLVKRAFKPLGIKLAALGLRPRSPGIFTVELAPGYLGWLGLNKAVFDDTVEINPVVGVRNEELEKLVTQFAGVDQPFLQPSVASPLGYLLPGNSYVTFQFGAADDYDVRADEIVTLIRDYGLPFMRAHQELPALCHRIRTAYHGPANQQAYRLACGYYLQRRVPEARAVIVDGLTRFGGGQGPAAKDFRSFARRFLEGTSR